MKADMSSIFGPPCIIQLRRFLNMIKVKIKIQAMFTKNVAKFYEILIYFNLRDENNIFK